MFYVIFMKSRQTQIYLSYTIWRNMGVRADYVAIIYIQYSIILLGIKKKLAINGKLG